MENQLRIAKVECNKTDHYRTNFCKIKKIKKIKNIKIIKNIKKIKNIKIIKTKHPALMLPGEINISQLQGKIEFNTFLFDKPYN